MGYALTRDSFLNWPFLLIATMLDNLSPMKRGKVTLNYFQEFSQVEKFLVRAHPIQWLDKIIEQPYVKYLTCLKLREKNIWLSQFLINKVIRHCDTNKKKSEQGRPISSSNIHTSVYIMQLLPNEHFSTLQQYILWLVHWLMLKLMQEDRRSFNTF